MIRIIKGMTAKLLRENDRIKMELNAEKQRNDEMETALVELAELFAEQDDALVEIAEIVGGME